MAQRAVPIIAALAVAGLIIGPVTAVLWRGGGFTALSAADLAALKFTIWQAFWSAFISVVLAVPVARALSRRS
ncbi:thiamine/thiamine pyrophosphate ABC transporter permease ThiP, partial [Octadecabacter sp.]|nr:thiamine/thiamine pyrophosphate ABC transporter permease ThiP [Octadecabacter sp.]